MELNEARRGPSRRTRARASVSGVTYILVCSGCAALSANEAPHAPGPTVNDATGGAALPSFQPGLWQYQRTLSTAAPGKPQVTVVKKCTDPSAEIARKMAELRGKSCRFTAVRREHDHYASSWVCPTPSGVMQFRDVFSAKDSTAYQDVSEARMGQNVRRQRIEATRLGDCTVAPAAPAAPAASAIKHESTAAAR